RFRSLETLTGRDRYLLRLRPVGLALRVLRLRPDGLALRVAVAPPFSRGRRFTVRFQVANDVADSSLLAFALQGLGDCARGRSRELDRHLLGFDHDDGFILLDRISRLLEPVTDLDFAYLFRDGTH